MLTHPRGDRKFAVSPLRIFVCVTDDKTHTHTIVCLIKTFPVDFLQLSTHHHLQSAQPLPSSELHYLFSSRPLYLSLPLSSTVAFVADLSCIGAAIYLLFFFLRLFGLSSPSQLPVQQGRHVSFIPCVHDMSQWAKIMMKSLDTQEIQSLYQCPHQQSLLLLTQAHYCNGFILSLGHHRIWVDGFSS